MLGQGTIKTLDYPCCRKLGTRHKAYDKVKNKNYNKEVIILHQAFCDHCSTIEGESELSRNWCRIIYQPCIISCTFTHLYGSKQTKHTNHTIPYMVWIRRSDKNGNKTNITSHLSSFYLEIEKRRCIIKLVIRKHPRPYRRSRGECKIFHRIATITSMETNRVKPNSTRTIDHTNVKAFKQQITENIVKLGTSLNCALLNCRSIIIKTQELQL